MYTFRDDYLAVDNQLECFSLGLTGSNQYFCHPMVPVNRINDQHQMIAL